MAGTPATGRGWGCVNKAFRLKVNQVGKYPTSWSLSKLQLFGVHMYIPLRAPTLVLELSNFDNPKAGKILPSLSSFLLFLHFLSTNCFPLCSFFFFLSFLFSFLFFFSFLISFGHFLSLFGATTHLVKRRKFPPHFLKPKVWLSLFHPFFPYFLNPLYDIITTWLNVSHGIHFPHMANCEPFFQCQVSLSYGAMWHPPTLPCVIRHTTPRKT